MKAENESRMDKIKGIKSRYLTFLRKYDVIDRYLRSIFVLLLMFHVAGCFLRTTTYGAYSSDVIVSVSMNLLTYVVIGRIPFLFCYERECKRAVAYCMALFLIYIFFPAYFLKQLGIFFLGCTGIDYRKILKAYVVTMGLCITFTIFATLTGATNHLVFWDEGEIRDSFGVCYPTDFSSYLFFLLLFFWIAWEKLPLWINALFGAGVLYVVNVLARSDTSTICCLVFLLILGMMAFGGWLAQRKPECLKYKWVVDLPLKLAFPFFASLMFLLIWGYSRGSIIAEKINAMVTGRIYLACRAIEKYGLSLGGVSIRQAGNGFTTFPVSDYEFVDSSYPLILLTRGVLFFLLILFIYVRMTSNAIKNKDYRLAFGLAVIALHSLAEHHFLEIHYNILLILPCALYAEQASEADAIDVRGFVGGRAFLKRNKKLIAVVGMIGAAFLTSPLWVSFVRTVVGWRRLIMDGSELGFAFAGYALMAFLVSFAIASVFSKGTKRKLCLGGSGVALLCIVVCSLLVLGRASIDVGNAYQDDLPILSKLDQAAVGKLHSAEYAWIYRKKLKKMEFTLMTGEDLGRKKNKTLIVPRGTEYYILFHKGYQYAAISDKEAVYTNDPGVLECLKKEGILVHDFYDELSLVKLPLNLAEEAYLRKGIYHVVLKLKANKAEPKTDKVAKLLIVGNFGHSTLFKDAVDVGEIDQDGNVTRDIWLSIKIDTPGIRFYVMAEDGCQMEVEQVSYQMTAKYENE